MKMTINKSNWSGETSEITILSSKSGEIKEYGLKFRFTNMRQYKYGNFINRIWNVEFKEMLEREWRETDIQLSYDSEDNTYIARYCDISREAAHAHEAVAQIIFNIY